MTDQKNTFKPDYLCHPQCVAQDALVEQMEARKDDTDLIARLQEVVHWVRETKRIAEESAGWAGDLWLNGTDEGTCACEALARLDGSVSAPPPED